MSEDRAARSIPTTLVHGFLEAGKTSYIMDCLLHDFFYKKGTTLVLCFEEGETAYDEDALAERRTFTAYYEGGEDITAFCRRQIEACKPDRIYVEMNAMTEGLREMLPPELRVVFSSLRIDAATLPLYARNMRQLLQNMAQTADQVTFRNCPDKDALAPFSRFFQLVNRKASFLWEAPGGYHEKAFDLFVPYDLQSDSLQIEEDMYLIFFLDSCAHPEHYEGKTLRLLCQAAQDASFREEAETAAGSIVRPTMHGGGESIIRAGRQVMTCCLADIQFLGWDCRFPTDCRPDPGAWFMLTARGRIAEGLFHTRRLELDALEVSPARPPAKLLLNGIS